MKIYIATDHRGVEVEQSIIELLTKSGYSEIIKSNIPHHDTDDYVDYALDICQRMDKQKDLGIVICGNGIGMSIIANKVKNIRCARVLSKDDAIAARSHNNANVIALGSTTALEMFELIDTFIKAPTINEEKHQKRVDKIIKYENGEYNVL